MSGQNASVPRRRDISKHVGRRGRYFTRLALEQLESRVVPASVITPHFEIPDFGAGATITSDSSGAWSNPDTWSAGRVPTAEDVVRIAAGTTVSFDVASSPALDSVVIYAGGVLNFRTDISTQLLVTNLQVMEGGELRMGTAADPVAAAVTAQIVFRNVPLDTADDPAQFGHGLVALGKVTMHGAAQSQGFVRLTAEPRMGDTTLVLAQPVTGWKVGDRLVLPDTRHLKFGELRENYVPQWERPTIQAISADGRTITLSAPLGFDHLGARNNAGDLDFLPHVANLSRNVVVKSQDAAGTRGYALFTQRADVDIRYVAFAGLGRTTQDALDNTTFDTSGAVTHVGANQSGRYPVYFAHLWGPAGGRPDGYQFAFVGNSVFCPLDPMPFRWGITLEDSHYGLIRGNVLYNWAGAGLAAIGGNESYNVIEANFVIATRGDHNPRDNDALDGSAFWFLGFNNSIRDNVATNAVGRYSGIVSGSGYNLFWSAASRADTPIPLFPGADLRQSGQYELINMQLTPLREFARNEVYGATATGMTIWHLGTSGYETEPLPVAESVVRDFTAWHVHEEAFFGYPINHVTFDGFVVRGDPRALNNFDGGRGWTSGDYWAGNVTIRHADIQGMYWAGVGASTHTLGTFTIEDSYFSNYMANISIPTLAAPGAGGPKPARQTIVRNVRFDPMPSGPYSSFPPDGRTIEMYYDTHYDNTDLIQTDQVFVYNYNGTGQNFQVYYLQQRPDFIVPQSDGSRGFVGSPVAGLTNQQNWNTYGIAIAGSVAPLTATTLPEIVGLVRTFTVAPDTTPPSSPTNLTTTVVSSTQINLTWTAATDNVAVAGYRIYRNGQLVGATIDTAYADTGLMGTAQYAYTVVAYDAAGNTTVSTDSVLMTANEWHNHLDPLNVDGIIGIAPADALLVINELNGRLSSDYLTGRLKPKDERSPNAYFDVNNDGFATAIDALLIINFLNASSRAGGEGESGDDRLVDLPEEVIDLTATAPIRRKHAR
jgi:hypothetical protein